MTNPYVVPAPAEKLISLTRGADAGFTVRRVNGPDEENPGDPKPFEAGAEVAIAIDIDKANPTVVQASVEDTLAAFVIDKAVADQVRSGARWRVVMTVGDAETPIMVGRFERHDG